MGRSFLLAWHHLLVALCAHHAYLQNNIQIVNNPVPAKHQSIPCKLISIILSMHALQADHHHFIAYQKNHRTETALVKIVNDLLCAIDSICN